MQRFLGIGATNEFSKVMIKNRPFPDFQGA
jgi:hypothetical protein